MKIRMVPSLPIPWGPGASPLHCLPSCFCVSLCHFCSCLLLLHPPPAPSLSLYSIFSSSFSLSPATHELFRGLVFFFCFFLKISFRCNFSLGSKCCDRRQVGETLEPDYRRETPWNSSCSSGGVPRLLFLCASVRLPLCVYHCVCECVCECVCVCVCFIVCLTHK